MKITKLGRLVKWLSVTFVALATLLSSMNLFSKEKVEVENLNETKNSVALTKVIKHETIETYNNKIPTGQTITKEEGQDGLSYVDENGNVLGVISEPVNAEIEIGTGKKADYVGKMTGYGADCAGCSSTGTVSCKTKNGLSHSLRNNGTTYKDDEYGNVRIIAADLSEFPCGTIINVDNPSLGEFTAIVLDTGGAMQRDWANGIVHMDLAFLSESDPSLYLATSSNVKYSVQRWGW